MIKEFLNTTAKSIVNLENKNYFIALYLYKSLLLQKLFDFWKVDYFVDKVNENVIFTIKFQDEEVLTYILHLGKEILEKCKSLEKCLNDYLYNFEKPLNSKLVSQLTIPFINATNFVELKYDFYQFCVATFQFPLFIKQITTYSNYKTMYVKYKEEEKLNDRMILTLNNNEFTICCHPFVIEKLKTKSFLKLTQKLQSEFEKTFDTAWKLLQLDETYKNFVKLLYLQDAAASHVISTFVA